MRNVEKYLNILVNSDECICVKYDDSLHFCSDIRCVECKYHSTEYDSCDQGFVAWMFDECKECDDSEVMGDGNY